MQVPGRGAVSGAEGCGQGSGEPEALGQRSQGARERGVPRLPSGGGVGEGTGTQVPLSSLFPLGQIQTGPLGLSRHSHSHFFRSQGLVTAGVWKGGG